MTSQHEYTWFAELTTGVGFAPNMPFPSYLLLLCHNDSSCEIIHMNGLHGLVLQKEKRFSFGS